MMEMPEMRKAQLIKEMIPKVNGIFGHMDYTFRAEISKANLDLQFYANYGKRNPAPLLEVIQETYGQQMTGTELTTLAGVILEMYKEKWDKLGRVYDIDYDPIHNYLDAWNDSAHETNSLVNQADGSTEVEYGKKVETELDRTDTGLSHTVTEEDNTSTRTDDLVKTETRDLQTNAVRTDDLKENITYGKTEERTDDLEETVNYGKNMVRTDDLGQTVSEKTSDEGSTRNSDSLYAMNSTAPNDSDVANSNSSSNGELTRNISNTGSQSETSDGSDSKSNTGTQTTSMSGTDSRENTGTRATLTDDEGTITTSDEGTATTVDDKNGKVDVSSTNTRDITTSEESSGKDTTTVGKTVTEDGSSDTDRTGRHFGNIGNLTSQKQILEEINLWKWNYVQEILNDVKEFCTLPVYLNASKYSLVDD